MFHTFKPAIVSRSLIHHPVRGLRITRKCNLPESDSSQKPTEIITTKSSAKQDPDQKEEKEEQQEEEQQKDYIPQPLKRPLGVEQQPIAETQPSIERRTLKQVWDDLFKRENNLARRQQL